MTKTPEPRTPTDKPQTLKAPGLSIVPPTVRGRPKKRVMPPLPGEVRAAMTELEVLHFDFFIASALEEFPDLTDFDRITLNMLALSYISVLRMEVMQLQSGELITMSRQDPRTQFMRYMDALSIRRRDRKPTNTQEEDPREVAFLKTLSR